MMLRMHRDEKRKGQLANLHYILQGHAGAHLAREQRVPVKPFLVPGNNTLTFRISPAVEAAQLRAAAYPYPVPSLCEPPAVPPAVPCTLHQKPGTAQVLHCQDLLRR